MTGDLYEAGVGQRREAAGVNVSTPVPMYDDAAIRELIVAIQSYREAIRRALGSVGHHDKPKATTAGCSGLWKNYGGEK